MKTSIFYILIILIASFVTPTNDVLACSKHASKEVAKTKEVKSSCCSKKEEPKTSKCCCSHAQQNEDEPMTPCGNCDCNCVQSVSYISSEFSLEINLITITTYYIYGWHYNQPLPEKPTYSIWQPPQLT